MNENPKIGLLGPYGAGNLGDASIQDAMMQNIRERFPEAKLYGFSLNPEDTEKRHGIPSFPIGRVSWQEEALHPRSLRLRISKYLGQSSHSWIRSLERWISRVPIELGLLRQAYANLKGFDLLIASGGGQIDDYWGGAWSHPYTLLRWAFLSRVRKTRFLFVSVGAGPLNSKLSRFFIRQALRLADYRSYRDEDSLKFIQSIGFGQDDPVYPDLAFSYDVSDISSYLTENAQTFSVGIGPLPFFDPRNWPEKDQSVYLEYLSKLADFSGWLIQNEARIVFLTGDIYPDRLVIDDLREEIKSRGFSYTEDQIIENPIADVNDLLNEIADTDIVLTSRFHGVLLSFLLNKPVLALSYHRKIDMLMNDMGQGDYCLQIDSFELGKLIATYQALCENIHVSKQVIGEKTREYQKALDLQYDRIFSNT